MNNSECRNKEQWIYERPDRVVAKLRNIDGTFVKSIIIPTVMYPLVTDIVRVFTPANTEAIEDSKTLELIDGVEYEFGCCYDNTLRLIQHFKENGRNDITGYAGWLFVASDQLPVHHCWAVIDGRYLIDMSDGYTAMMASPVLADNTGKSTHEMRTAMVTYIRSVSKQKNSIRCAPMGKASENLVYVGCECEPMEAQRLYRQLTSDYPNHECQRNVNKSGLNTLQEMYYGR